MFGLSSDKLTILDNIDGYEKSMRNISKLVNESKIKMVVKNEETNFRWNEIPKEDLNIDSFLSKIENENNLRVYLNAEENTLSLIDMLVGRLDFYETEAKYMQLWGNEIIKKNQNEYISTFLSRNLLLFSNFEGETHKKIHLKDLISYNSSVFETILLHKLEMMHPRYIHLPLIVDKNRKPHSVDSNFIVSELLNYHGISMEAIRSYAASIGYPGLSEIKKTNLKSLISSIKKRAEDFDLEKLSQEVDEFPYDIQDLKIVNRYFLRNRLEVMKRSSKIENKYKDNLEYFLKIIKKFTKKDTAAFINTKILELEAKAQQLDVLESLFWDLKGFNSLNSLNGLEKVPIYDDEIVKRVDNLLNHKQLEYLEPFYEMLTKNDYIQNEPSQDLFVRLISEFCYLSNLDNSIPFISALKNAIIGRDSIFTISCLEALIGKEKVLIRIKNYLNFVKDNKPVPLRISTEKQSKNKKFLK